MEADATGATAEAQPCPAQPARQANATTRAQDQLAAAVKDSGQGSTHAKIPYKGKNKPESQKQANKAHARLRAPGERANAQLKTWRILRKLRCCPWRTGERYEFDHKQDYEDALAEMGYQIEQDAIGERRGFEVIAQYQDAYEAIERALASDGDPIELDIGSRHYFVREVRATESDDYDFGPKQDQGLTP